MSSNRTKKPVAKQPEKVAPAEKGISFSIGGLSLLLAVVAFIVYANTLKNGFAMDDAVMIVNNSYVTKGVSAIPELLATPHQRGFWVTENDEYRPLPLVLHAVVYQFTGDNPMPFHLMNILLFAGCVVLLFRFLVKLFDGERTTVAFIAALLFALHPLHTEVVANIKSSDEMLSFFFAFLGMNVFLAYAKSGKPAQLFAGFLCIFLAYLSKETVITFLAIIPLVFFFYRDENRKRGAYILGCAIAATAVFLAIRFAVLNHYNANNLAKINIIENALAKEGLPAESRIATAILILGYYLKLLLVPYPLVSEYSFNSIPYTHFSDWRVLLSLALYISIAAIGLIRFVKNKKDPYAFGIFFFLVTIALFSNLLIMVKSTMAERFMFFPSVGFCLVAALLVEKWLAKPEQDKSIFNQPKIWALLAPLCIIYSVITIDRNSDWQDNYTLFSADIKKTPENSHMNYLLGYNLFSAAKQERDPATQEQLMNDAIKYMRKSVSLLPDYYFGVTDLGAAYFYIRQYDSAEKYDLLALQLRPDAAVSRNNLSGLFMATKQYRRNIDHCKTTISLTRDNPNAYADLSVSYMNLGINDSAIHYLYQGIAVAPDFYGCYDILGYLYYKMGKTDSAVKYQNIARQLMNNRQ
ncbi:MAG: Tetratricopeptide 1 repeat-containing protein [Flavipsychrobacter sp.]|jgi:tetratricopeptide (TPR) repeat protein|nr:Tetratricopeptide 1 repeat-containing protein [Flavipsychrobacter sp.]